MAKRKAFTLAYAIVDGGDDFRACAFAEQDGRVDTLIATVNALKPKEPGLLVFPAGYFQVANQRARDALERRILTVLDNARPRFGVVVGVDVDAPASAKVSKKRATQPPFYALYRPPSGKHVWMQQVCIYADEGRDLDLVESRWGQRDLLLAGTDIALLICGESWSDVLMKSKIADSGARALVVAAHATVSMHKRGTGWENISWHLRLGGYSKRLRLPILLSEHTRTPDRHPYCWPKPAAKVLTVADLPTGVSIRFAAV